MSSKKLKLNSAWWIFGNCAVYAIVGGIDLFMGQPIEVVNIQIAWIAVLSLPLLLRRWIQLT